MNWTKSKKAKEIIKFVVVGAINTGLDLFVLNVLIQLSNRGRDGFYFSFFKGISFIAALINSYFMNKYWTFAGAKKKKSSIELSQFLAVSLGGLFINNLAATYVFHNISAPASLYALWPTIAGMSGSAAGLLWNYFGYKTFVFKHHHPDLLPPA